MQNEITSSIYRTLHMVADREAQEAVKKKKYDDLVVLNVLSVLFKEAEKAAEGGLQVLKK